MTTRPNGSRVGGYGSAAVLARHCAARQPGTVLVVLIAATALGSVELGPRQHPRPAAP